MPIPAAAAPRMILSSMSVMFITQVTWQAAPAQVADQEVGEQERPEVADVGRSVDRRAARVDPDPVGPQRDERPGLAGQRVVEADRHRVARDHGDGERRDRPAGTLGAVEVAGRRLDVDGRAVEAEQLARSPSRIASRWRPSRGRAAITVTSTEVGRQPASASRPTDRARGARRWRSRAASARRPGRGARGRPGRPPRAARRRPRGGRRRRRSGRRGAARPAISTPPSTSGVARPERMAVVPDPGRASRAAPVSDRLGPGEIVGQRSP